jgi:hypothetical protein
MKKAVNTTSSQGTSFHGQTVYATVNQLIKILGEPDFTGDTSDKSQYDWIMQTNDGTVFTVYDWKEYRKYSKDKEIEWHIGAHRGIDAIKGMNEIEKELKQR